MLQLFSSPQAGKFGRRLRHERGARLPVTVLTGFLGAGKTTLLKRFLDRPEGRNTAIVVNEFGEVGIDDILLRSSAAETVLLRNGCLCCNVRSDLQNALRALVADRDRGELPHFARIVIETSGLADPGPILRTFATDRALGGEFHAQGVISVADAVNGVATLERYPEARRQVVVADRLVVTKTDLADSASTQKLQKALRALNPRAPIETAREGGVEPAAFTGERARLEEASEFFAEATHSDGIGSFVFTSKQPMDWDVFARSMETLVALRGADILRVKGLLNVAGCSGPVVVQFVQHLAHPPVELDAWPEGERNSRIVFITRGITEREVKALFASVGALARP
jgi:G3E family GTPase